MWRKLVNRGKGIQIAHLNQRALQFYEQGKYEQALIYAEQARDLADHHLRKEHSLYMTCLDNLALLHKSMGHYAQAAQYLEQNLATMRASLGEQHSDVATSLNNLAVLYEEMGNYGSAELFLQQALALTRHISGETHPDVAVCLCNLATLYSSMGRYEQAEQLYYQGLEMLYTSVGEQHPSVAANFNNLASLYRQMGRYSQAKPLLEKALIISSDLWGLAHPDVYTSLSNLAELYCAMGDYSKAEQLLQSALILNQSALGAAHLDTATSLNNLAGLYNTLGNYTQAESRLKEALAVRSAALGEQHPDVAQSLNNLAVLYTKTGNYIQAELFFKRALDITRIVLGEQHPDVATSLNNLAELYRTWGKYDRAEPLLQQALQIQYSALGENHLDVAQSLNNLSLLYELIGDNAKAEQFDHQALTIRRTILGEEHPEVAQSLNNLAVLLQKNGDYAQAQTLYQQALDIKRTALGEMHPSFATSLHNLAALYELMGDDIKAEQLYQQALELRRQVLGEKHPDVATSLNNLAALYESRGSNAEAEQLYGEALEIRRIGLGEAHPDVAVSLNNLALLYAATHRETETFTLLLQLSNIYDQVIGQVFTIGSERQRLEYLATLQGSLDIFLSLILQHFRHSSEVIQTGFNFVLRRKGIGAEAQIVQRDAILSDRYPNLNPKLHALNLLRAQIALKTLSSPGLEGAEAHYRLLKDWNDRREQLEVELARQIPEMNLARELQKVDQQAVARALPPATALVEFVRCKHFNFQEIPKRGKARWKGARYLAFVLFADQPGGGQMVDLGEADPIDRQISVFRMAVTGEMESDTSRHLKPRSTLYTHGTAQNVGIALRKAVFDPLLSAFGGLNRLFLAADGDLTQLPFEILPTDSGHYLIDEYQISYLSAGRDILRLRYVPSSKPAPSLVLANPDFDLCDDSLFPGQAEVDRHGEHRNSVNNHSPLFKALPGTQIEGEQIAILLGVEPLTRERVLEGILKTCPTPYIFHIATHGFFLPDQKHASNDEVLETLALHESRKMSKLEQLQRRRSVNPLLRSGLALAGANTWDKGGSLPPEAEDGMLTAEDVSGLDLSATELVVLSACQTGLGEVLIGEGVFGLRRAFVLAGAKTLIMSLWKIPDEQTQELMVNFYRRILENQPRAAALRGAQLALKIRYPHPYYWGAFICQGDPGSLPLLPSDGFGEEAGQTNEEKRES